MNLWPVAFMTIPPALAWIAVAKIKATSRYSHRLEIGGIKIAAQSHENLMNVYTKAIEYQQREKGGT